MRKTILNMSYSELQAHHANAVRRNLPASQKWLERRMAVIRRA